MSNTRTILNYLQELQENNDREWYHAHKEERKEAEAAFESFLEDLIVEISKFDASIPLLDPHTLTFKMVRDTRFSHDVSPYLPAFRAHIAAKGKLPIPVGYYIVIKPHQETMICGGLFADMFQDATMRIRNYLNEHGAAFDAILSDPKFASYFQLKGTKLKNVPRGYDKNHPYGDYLKHKSWYIEYALSDDLVKNDMKFLQKSAELCEIIKPFNDFLNTALVGFEMPKRQ